jgi:hypothetical protein
MLPIAQHNSTKYQLRKFLKEMPKGTVAYVAGGAPRDWHHGWGCRDVDIFFQAPETVETLAALGKYEPMCESYGYGYMSPTDQGILSIHEYKINQGSLRFRNVQLIRVQGHPLDVIKDFPINLSHIWMDSSGRIECDFYYESGYHSRIIAAVHNKQYYYPYLEKILPRFDDYAFTPKGWEPRNEEQL